MLRVIEENAYLKIYKTLQQGTQIRLLAYYMKFPHPFPDCYPSDYFIGKFRNFVEQIFAHLYIEKYNNIQPCPQQ